MKRPPLPLTLVVAIPILLLASAWIVKSAPEESFVCNALLWFLAAVALLPIATAAARPWVAHFAFFVLLLGGVEAYLAGWLWPWLGEPRTRVVYDSRYHAAHPVLGYAAKKDFSTRVRRTYGKRQSYDVVYTLDPQGFRVGPGDAGDSADAVLFLGGSFTFGDGVDDHETLPYRFEQLSGGRFRGHNLGFSGYGPHQALTLLEHRMEAPALGQKRPLYAVYQALPDHVLRASGKALWDVAGPRYVLDREGKPTYQGPFHSSLSAKAHRFLSFSHLATRLFLAHRTATPQDLDLYVGLVLEIRRVFVSRYGGTFYVLLWPGHGELSSEMLSRLQEAGVPVLRVDRILGDLPSHGGKYRLADDAHPNALAYDELARHLLDVLDERRLLLRLPE